MTSQAGEVKRVEELGQRGGFQRQGHAIGTNALHLPGAQVCKAVSPSGYAFKQKYTALPGFQQLGNSTGTPKRGRTRNLGRRARCTPRREEAKDDDPPRSGVMVSEVLAAGAVTVLPP